MILRTSGPPLGYAQGEYQVPSSKMTAPPSYDGGVTNVNRFFKVLRTVDFKEPVDISNKTLNRVS